MERDPASGRKMINQYLVFIYPKQCSSTPGPRRDRTRHTWTRTPGTGSDGRDRSTLCYQDCRPESQEEAPYRTQPKEAWQDGYRKRVSDAGSASNDRIRKEIAIFKKVNHPNVVRMKEIIDDPDSSKLFMILEHCDQGEVKWKLDPPEFGPALTVEQTRSIFRDTLLGLEYCKSRWNELT
jgi:serine/threonine protein kinase